MSARGLGEPRRAAEELSPELGRAWARAWRSWFGAGRVPLPRAPEREELALVETPLGRVVAKRTRVRGWKGSLAALGARTPRAERAFEAGRALLARGLATPEPLAVLGRPRDAVLVTRYVEGRGPWEVLAQSGAVEELLATLAAGLARLHACGFRHRDLKASNLLLREGGAGPELVWTDLDGLRQIGTVEPRVRARDLARLGTSFESAEARAAGIRAGHWGELVRRYLGAALGREASAEEVGEMLGWTRRWSERWVRKQLAEGRVVR